MNEKDLIRLEQVSQFLDGTQAVAFTVLSDKKDRYQWIARTLIRFEYDKLKRSDKGLIMRYLIKISGYSRQQLTRLIAQYRNGGRLIRRQRTTQGFTRSTNSSLSYYRNGQRELSIQTLN